MDGTTFSQQMNPQKGAVPLPQRGDTRVLLDCKPLTCTSGLRAKLIGTKQPTLKLHAEIFEPKSMTRLAKLHVPATLPHAVTLGETCLEFAKGTFALQPPAFDGLTWVKTRCQRAVPFSRAQDAAVYEAKPADAPAWFMLAVRPRMSTHGHRAGFNWYTRNREVLNKVLEQIRHGELSCEPA